MGAVCWVLMFSDAWLREAFRNLLSCYGDPEEVLKLTEMGEVPSLEAYVLYQFAYMKQHYSIIVVTDGMSEEEINEIGMEYAPTVNDALMNSFKLHGDAAKVMVAPYASITYTGSGCSQVRKV
ncbi:MAG: hypothetical protein AOA65_0759 [Candidatus Bathyarchaeota archaeon BA1]|nr:MAG: hypothetical protein AOA65_0759 [Candidatus Bathyarchaeota archaeon BA1]